MAKATRELCRAAVELENLRIALAVVGEAPALYVMIVGIERSLNNIERVRVRPQELWLKAWIQPDHILIHEDLAAHTGTGADADRWNLQQLRHLSSSFARYAFEHQRETSSTLKFTRLRRKNLYRGVGARLYLHAAESVE